MRLSEAERELIEHACRNADPEKFGPSFNGMSVHEARAKLDELANTIRVCNRVVID